MNLLRLERTIATRYSIPTSSKHLQPNTCLGAHRILSCLSSMDRIPTNPKKYYEPHDAPPPKAIYPRIQTGTLVIVSRSTILPGYKDPEPATIEIDRASGKIKKVHVGVLKAKDQYPDESRFEWRLVKEGHVVMPGLVDAHVHLNAPGRTAWEGHQSGSLAAISGGVTTIIDMPLNSLPPTTTVENFEAKMRMARFAVEPDTPAEPELLKRMEEEKADASKAEKGEVLVGGQQRRLLDVLKKPRLESNLGGVWCDLGFWGGLLPDNLADLRPLLEHGVKGFKCFMIDSGVEEFPHVGPKDIKLAFKELKNTPSMILFHAEHGTPTNVENHPSGEASYQRFLDSRPDSLETSAIKIIIDTLKDQAKLKPKPQHLVGAHIVHLATGEAVPMIKAARDLGLPLTVETTYHYLLASADSVPNTPTPSTEYKCCPPLRSDANRLKLWEALEAGLIDTVVSDHSPCTPELKDGGAGGFMKAWGGISALGLGLSLLWTECSRRNLLKAKGQLPGEEVGLSKIVEWCATSTAKQVNLSGVKGVIAEGADADLVVFDPEAVFKVSKDSLLFKNKISLFIGQTLKGVVKQTYLRGNVVWDGDRGGPQGKRLGQLL